MCGIYGFSTKKPSKENAEMFRRLMLASSFRGRDATGILFVTPDKKITHHKLDVTAEEYERKYLPEFMEGLSHAVVALGHVRAATMGSEKINDNNHPVESDNWFCIHNGQLHDLPRILP